MITDYQIPEPFLFNPLKHHLGYIREFINSRTDGESIEDIEEIIKRLKHLGTSVMDIYSGPLSVNATCMEIEEFLRDKDLLKEKSFSGWTGIKISEFKIIILSDSSKWTLKYHNSETRFVHIFPARSVNDGSGSLSAFRVKSNTLKTAVLYNIIIGKDYINKEDLNKVRILLGLSPVKNTTDSETVLEMIDILRR